MFERVAVGDRELRTPARDSAPRAAPTALRVASPAEIVAALQRTAGNRLVSRSLTRQLARDPVADPPRTAPAVHYEQQTTAANREMGKQIDELQSLTDAQLLERREGFALKAGKWFDDLHGEYESTLEAAEFEAERRGLAPLAYRSSTNINDHHAAQRRNVRAALQDRVRANGSLKDSIAELREFTGLDADLDFLEKEATQFGHDFRGQAHDVADGMLVRSQNDLLDTLQRYGVKREPAWAAAKDVVRGTDARDVAKRVVADDRAWLPEPDNPGNDWDKASPERRRRVVLGQLARALAEEQHRVKSAKKAVTDITDSPAYRRFGPTGNQQAALAEAERKLGEETARLQAMWADAERRQRVFAGFRGGTKDLETVDLGDLGDTEHGSGPQMTEMLANLLQKLADIITVSGRIKRGVMNPLALPPVVALTKAIMFVPEGSIRAGQVNDLVEAAQDKSIAKYIAEGLIALIVLATVIPSGGTTLGVAVGLAGAALSATSAIEDWETYKREKLTTNTALERAQALSTEEPSLVPFAIDLISLGLDGAPLVKAFSKGLELRNLVRAGDEVKNSKRITQLVDELDKVDPKKAPKLGEEALQEVRDAEQTAAKDAPKPTAKTKAPDKLEETPDKTPVSNKKGSKTGPDKSSKKVADRDAEDAGKGGDKGQKGAKAARPKPTTPKRETRVMADRARMFHTSEADLRSHLTKALDDAMETTAKELNAAKIANPRAELERLVADVQKRDPAFAKRIVAYYDALEDTRSLREHMVWLWQQARDNERTVAEELEALVGGKAGVNKYHEPDLDMKKFKDALADPRALEDLTFASDFHGTHVHMFHQLLGDLMWGPGEGLAFRQRLISEPEWDKIWDVLFDATNGRQGGLHVPETLGRILQQHLDFPRYVYTPTP
jgi:hypothetical protein